MFEKRWEAAKLPGELVAVFQDFFSESTRKNALLELAATFPEKRSIAIEFSELERFDPKVADALLAHPDDVTRDAETAVAELSLPTPTNAKFTPHVRFHSLPDSAVVEVKELGAAHLNKLSRVEGAVSWITEIKPLMKTALWECLHCGATTKTVTQKTVVAEPVSCRCGHGGRENFRLLEQSSDFINIQRAGMQEAVEKMKGSAPASRIELWLEDDLVNALNPGDKVWITGVLRLKQQKSIKGRSSVYDKFLDVMHIQKVEREFEEITISKEEETKIRELARDPRIYDKIRNSIAPSMYGYDELKQAIAFQLFGGTPGKIMPDGKRCRSDVHVLLIGDPGVGKSMLLESVSRLAPKNIFVSGGGASGVGMTASAERDADGEGWILKAGAMVLANGGMAIIDEFDKMSDEDRGLMHEAMEQQVVSIAKAGIVTRFKARTAILAAANPKLGRFDPNRPPSEQFALSPALMSRFDLIFAVKDFPDEARDRGLVGHVLASHKLASEKRAPEPGSPINPEIPPELLRKYIAFARKNIFPILTEEAMRKIEDYYIELRKLGEKQGNVPVTPRQLDAVIRLSEASAKIRLSDKVEVADAERAIAINKFVLQEIFVDKETGRIDSDVINIGQPKSKVDKMRSLLGIINELEKQTDLVAIEDVFREAAQYGMDEVYVRQLLETLERQGDLYRPKAGHVRSARRREW
ncbi:MAG: minichromosome maintenance protein MCM [Candidatus Norongarragalinales archaeon]